MQFEEVIKGLKLPNSVMVSDNQILIAEGGSDCIRAFSADNFSPQMVLGSFGKSEYQFREPVNAIYTNNRTVAVCDWHNHRIVFYNEDLIYEGEVGHFADENVSSFVNFYRRLRYSHSSLGTYLNDEGNSLRHRKSLLGVLYRKFHWSVKSYLYDVSRFWVLNNKNVMLPLNKPNGLCSISDKLVVTVKNSKKIVVFCLTKQMLEKEIKSEQFGRLGQCCEFIGNSVLVCDETNRCLWQISLNDEKLVKIPLNMARPFSVTCGNGDVYVAGGNELIVYDHNFLQLAKCSIASECHGLFYHDSNLYMVDRGYGILYRAELVDEIQ